MAARRPKTIPTYPGPSRDDVERMANAKVHSELERLKVDLWSKPLLEIFLDDPDLDHPRLEWSKQEIAEAKRKAEVAWRSQLKGQLYSAYLAEWITTLNAAACWLLVEHAEHAAVTLSEKRYTALDKLRERTRHAVYQIQQRGAK